MYGQGNNGAQFRHTYPSPSPSSFQTPSAASSRPPFQPLQPPLQPGLTHPSSNQYPPTMYSQPLPPSQPARQPLMHMTTPSNYGSNPSLPSYIPPTGNLNARFIPPPAFPPPRVLPPFGASTQDQFMYRNPHPPTTGIYLTHVPHPSSFIPSNRSPFVPAFHDAVHEAPLPSLPPDSPPPPPPPPSPPPSSSSPLPKSQVDEVLKQQIVNDYESDSNIIHDSRNEGRLTDSVKVEEVEEECSSEGKEPPGNHSPPPTRPEDDVVHNIEMLCKFMVDVGPQYESLAREKEANNPSFSFLFGGVPGSADAIGYDYFNWMKRKHRLESDPLKTESSFQVSASPRNSTSDNKPTTPSESDMDMDDNASQPEERQSISELSKESNKEVMSQPVTEEQLSARSSITKEGVPEMPLADFPSRPNSPLHDVRRSPAHTSSVVSCPAMQQLVTLPVEDAAAVDSLALVHSHNQDVEAPPELVKDGSPLGLIEDYASDDREDANVKEFNVPHLKNRGKETSKTSHLEDGEDEKDLFSDQHMDSSLKVDEFGRMVKETASSSDSEEIYFEKRYVRRGRSRSRSNSPEIKRRRTRSPKSWRERRSPSPSCSPRGHSRPWDHRRQRMGPPLECYNFRRGRCFRGASCWYSHHDIGHSNNRPQNFRNISQDSRHMRREWTHRHERSLPDGRNGEVSRDTVDLHSSSSFKGEGLSRDSSFDSIKDDGKQILPSEEVGHKEFDQLSVSEKASDSSLMHDTGQKSAFDSDNVGLHAPETRKLPDVEDQVAHNTLAQPTTSPSAESPKSLSTQEELHSRSQMPAGQLLSVETPVGPNISKPDPGPVFVSHQNQDHGFSHFIQSSGFISGDSHLRQSQTLQPPFQVNPPFLPSFPLSMPESMPGHRPQFSFLHGPKPAIENSWQASRADTLPQPPPLIDGFSAVRPSLASDYHPLLVPPKLPSIEPSWPPISQSHIQQTTTTHFGPEVSSRGSLTIDHHQVLRPAEARNPINEYVQRPPPSVIPHDQPFEGNYFARTEQSKSTPEPPAKTFQQNSSAHLRPEVLSLNNLTVDHRQVLHPAEERNPMNEFMQRPPASGMPHGQPFEGNYFTSTEQPKSTLPSEPLNITFLQSSAAHLRPEVSSRSDLIFDHRQVLLPAERNPMTEFMQRPLSQPFEGNYFTSVNQSKLTLPPEPSNITPQGFHGSSSASLSYNFLPNRGIPENELRPHLPDLGLPKLPLPAHYSPLPFTSARRESSPYDSSFVRGHSLGHHGLPNIASSSLIPEPQETSASMPNKPEMASVSDQYDPLFDSIDQPSQFDHSRANKIENNQFGETEVGVAENESPVSPVDFEGKGTGEVDVDKVRSPGKTKKSNDSKSMKLLKIALANFVKEILKPSWRQGTMSKEAYKTIVKKTVDKVSGSVSGHHLPRSQGKIDHYVESSRRKLTKLVMGYVDKYVKG